eukprot:7070224-Prymnesium_polylepis.1
MSFHIRSSLPSLVFYFSSHFGDFIVSGQLCVRHPYEAISAQCPTYVHPNHSSYLIWQVT